MHYVILGASAAGISAAKAVRENDSASDITIVNGEKAGAYFRPMIPAIISGKKSEQDILYPEDPLQGKNIRSVLGTAVGVDTKKKEVLLASGERIGFDSLLIATGCAALKPPIPGLDGSGVYALRNLAQAVRIREVAGAAQSAVVIGGGLVGVKSALALRERASGAAMSVTVVEVLPEILQNRLDRTGANMVRAAVEREGIFVVTGQKVDAIVRSGSDVAGVKLRSGRILPANLVIVAAGVKPDIGYLRHSGIRMNRGVLVDEYLRTNISGIYAAGDVAEGRDLITGARTVSGLWTNAREMGRLAGINMCGGKAKYPGFLSVRNASEIAGVPFISVGLIEPAGTKNETMVHQDEDGYWKLVFEKDLLVGAVFVGDIRRAGFYTNLIKNRIPISKFRSKVIKRAAGYADVMAR